MADRRRLQAEIDRTLKKVIEGRQVFQDTLTKFEQAATQTQKEKFEADLKKEIKKLQRFRDQIKTWLTSNDVKDKAVLQDYRKEIEVDMERFKVIEKETKTKAYSKEGLVLEVKKDPLQKEKEELEDWFKQVISKISINAEKVEFDIETALNTVKKKRNDRDKTAAVESKKAKLDELREHIKWCEMCMRCLDNDNLNLEVLKDIRDDIDYFTSDPEYNFKVSQYEELIIDPTKLESDTFNVSNRCGAVGDLESGLNEEDFPTHSSIEHGIEHITKEIEIPTISTISLTTTSTIGGNTIIGPSPLFSDLSDSQLPVYSTINIRQRQKSVDDTKPTTVIPPNSTKAAAAAVTASYSSKAIGGISTTNLGKSTSTNISSNSLSSAPQPIPLLSSSSNINSTIASTPSSILINNKTTINNNPLLSSPMVSTAANVHVLSNTTTAAAPVVSSFSAAVSHSQSSAPGGGGVGGNTSKLFNLNGPVSALSSSSSASVSTIDQQNFVQPVASIPNVSSTTVNNNDSLTEFNQHYHNQHHHRINNNAISLNSTTNNPTTPTTCFSSSANVPFDDVLKKDNFSLNENSNLYNSSTINNNLHTLSNSLSSSSSSSYHHHPHQQQQQHLHPTTAINAPTPSELSHLFSRNNMTLSAATTTTANAIPTDGTLQSNNALNNYSFDMSHLSSYLPDPMVNNRSLLFINNDKVNGGGGGGGSAFDTIISSKQQQQDSFTLPSKSTSGGSNNLHHANNDFYYNSLNQCLRNNVQSVNAAGGGGGGGASRNTASSSSLGGGCSTMTVNPLDACSPFRSKNLSSEQLFHSEQLLEMGYRRATRAEDSNRARMTLLKLPPSYETKYPKEPIHGSHTDDYYSKLDASTLFFIFYYFEGSRAQYLASKALKKKSWRFHKKHLLWFQRLEEPKNIDEDYESGAYIFWDVESKTQMKKENFKFEYRYLEDSEST